MLSIEFGKVEMVKKLVLFFRIFRLIFVLSGYFCLLGSWNFILVIVFFKEVIFGLRLG